MVNSENEDASLDGNTGPLLQIALNDPDVLRSQWALEQLKQHDCGQEESDLLITSMRDPVPEIRRRAIQLYDQLAFAEVTAIPHLLNSLNDVLWTIREAGTSALAPYISNDEVHAALIQSTLLDKSSFVREAAIRSLSQSQEQQQKTLDALLVGLKHKKPPVRWRAATGLSYFQDSAEIVLPDLILALNDSHRRVRLAAIMAIEKFGAQAVQALPTILRRRFENDLAIKKAAVEAIRAILPGVPPSLHRSIKPPIEWYQNANQILRDTLSYYVLPEEVQTEFVEHCKHRLVVLTKRYQGENISINDDSNGWEAACAVLNATGATGRVSDEKKETARLLAVLVEIWLKY